jgi:hypothetical protein
MVIPTNGEIMNKYNIKKEGIYIITLKKEL